MSFSILIGQWENNRRDPLFKTARKYIKQKKWLHLDVSRKMIRRHL